MKLQFALRASLALALLSSPVLAATLTWDTDPLTPGVQDGSGTWDLTTASFWDGTNNQIWNNANNDTVAIGSGGTAGTISLIQPVTLGGLTLNATTSGNYLLSGSVLAFGGSTPTIALGANRAQIDSVVAGTAGFTLTGTSGALTLTAAESISGHINLGGGQLTLTGTGALANNPAGITVGGGGLTNNPLAVAGGTVPGAVLLINDAVGTPVADRFGTTPVTLNGGTLLFASQSTGSATTVQNVSVNTQGWITAAPGTTGLATINLTNLNVGPTATVTFQSEAGAIGGASGTNGQILIGKLNGSNLAKSGAKIIGGWATTQVAGANGDFAAYTATGIKAVTYQFNKIALSTAITDNIGPNTGETLAASATINSLKSTGKLTLNDQVTLTLNSGGLLFTGDYHNIVAATGASAAITAGPGGNYNLFVTTLQNGTGSTANSFNISVPIIDNGPPVSLVKGGPGTLTLATAVSTYTGPTIINEGTLQIGTGGATVNISSASNIIDNANLVIARSGINFGNLITGNGSVEIAAPTSGTNTTETLSNPNNSFSGPLIIDAGAPVAASASLSGTNSVLGALIPRRNILIGAGGITAGSLTLKATQVLAGPGSSAAALPTLTLNNGQLLATQYNAVGNLVLSNGSLVSSSATPAAGYEGFQFLGDVTVTGTTGSTISNTSSANDHLLGGGTTNFNVTVTAGGGAADLTILAGLLDGSPDFPGIASLNKTGAGTLVLAGANTYSGSTTISGGTLQIGNGGTSGSLGAGPVTNNGTLVFNRSDASLVISNAIGGTGSFVQNGTGTTTLAGTNLYTGGTLINAGILNVTGSLARNGSDKVILAANPVGDFNTPGPTITRAVALSGSYAGLGSSISSDLFSAADIRAGKNDSGADSGVSMQWRTPAGGAAASGLASDVVNLSGMVNSGDPRGETDPFTLQLSYDPTVNADVQLSWLNPNTAQWENAIDGNFDTGALAATDVALSWDDFASSNFITDDNLGQYLGSWGVDASDHLVWAVVDHNSEFAVQSVQAVPEPSSLELAGWATFIAVIAVGLRIRNSVLNQPHAIATKR